MCVDWAFARRDCITYQQNRNNIVLNSLFKTILSATQTEQLVYTYMESAFFLESARRPKTQPKMHECINTQNYLLFIGKVKSHRIEAHDVCRTEEMAVKYIFMHRAKRTTCPMPTSSVSSARCMQQWATPQRKKSALRKTVTKNDRRRKEREGEKDEDALRRIMRAKRPLLYYTIRCTEIRAKMQIAYGKKV